MFVALVNWLTVQFKDLRFDGGHIISFISTRLDEAMLQSSALYHEAKATFESPLVSKTGAWEHMRLISIGDG